MLDLRDIRIPWFPKKSKFSEILRATPRSISDRLVFSCTNRLPLPTSFSATGVGSPQRHYAARQPPDRLHLAGPSPSLPLPT